MIKMNDDEVLAQDELLFLAEGLAPMSLDNNIKDRIKQTVKKRLSGECPDGGKTIKASFNEWFELNEHVSIKILHQDHVKKVQTALWRLKPGTVLTSHRHDNDEECLVMEGGIKIGEHELAAGDFHYMEKGSYHPEITSENGALLYLKHDMHAHLMGPDVYC